MLCPQRLPLLSQSLQSLRYLPGTSGAFVSPVHTCTSSPGATLPTSKRSDLSIMSLSPATNTSSVSAGHGPGPSLRIRHDLTNSAPGGKIGPSGMWLSATNEARNGISSSVFVLLLSVGEEREAVEVLSNSCGNKRPGLIPSNTPCRGVFSGLDSRATSEQWGPCIISRRRCQICGRARFVHRGRLGSAPSTRLFGQKRHWGWGGRRPELEQVTELGSEVKQLIKVHWWHVRKRSGRAFTVGLGAQSCVGDQRIC